MIESIKEQVFKASESYFTDLRKEWVLKWPGQVVSCVSCMSWTQEVEDALDRDAKDDYLQKCNDQIFDLVDLVRGKLSAGAQLTIEALIVLDVHARDVVNLLIQAEVISINEFNWISQMRYYWRTSPEKQGYVSVCMVTTDVEYGMEYLGNTSRLVITPLTDRCFRTLMGALKLNLGGAPEGKIQWFPKQLHQIRSKIISLLKDLLELERQKPVKTSRRQLQKNVSCSIVVMDWTTKLLENFSKDWLNRDAGLVSMSSTELS